MARVPYSLITAQRVQGTCWLRMNYKKGSPLPPIGPPPADLPAQSDIKAVDLRGRSRFAPTNRHLHERGTLENLNVRDLCFSIDPVSTRRNERRQKIRDMRQNQARKEFLESSAYVPPPKYKPIQWWEDVSSL